MKPFRFKLALTLKTPFLVQASMGGGFGLDALLARDEEHNPYLPADSVVGKLREAWCDLSRVSGFTFLPRVDDWLGAKSSTPDDAPQRRRIKFESLKLVRRATRGSSAPEVTEDSEGAGAAAPVGAPRSFARGFFTLPRIQIDEERHSAKKGALMLAEQPCRPGREMTFAGECYGYVDDPDNFRRHLIAGLRWIPQIGAERTVGFGRVLRVDVEDLGPGPQGEFTSTVPASCTRLGLRLRLTEPFCLAKRRVAENIFESDVVISGGALKGAVATLLGCHPGQYPELERHLDKLTFRHAFPSDAPQARAVVTPLSLVKVKDKVIGKQLVFDVARCEKPVLINGRAPAFRIDWKDDGGLEHYGRAEVGRRLQVRTEIDSSTLRAAENKLFVYESIKPGETIWLSEVLLPGNDGAPTAALQELERLLCQAAAPQGLKFLGKTDARAEVEFDTTVKFAQLSDPKPVAGGWIVTLQTPALLCSPEGMANPKEGYETVWKELSGEQLELSHFFASQSLAGGGYLYRRFMDTSKPYRPFLLTDPGSVFVLKLAQGDQNIAIKTVEGWLRNGLPLPGWARNRYARSGEPLWQTCPFLPENGFGEVAVNLPDHDKLSRGAKFTELDVL
ncbi:MAG: RAMP superfamily CRISPR-associated protein [Gammaproteobacteria bacterium]